MIVLPTALSQSPTDACPATSDCDQFINLLMGPMVSWNLQLVSAYQLLTLAPQPAIVSGTSVVFWYKSSWFDGGHYLFLTSAGFNRNQPPQVSF